MPKNKRPTRKQQQGPYPTPPRPIPNSHSTRAAPSIPGARNFPPPAGFTPAVPNPAYPQCVLTPDELSQSLQDFAKSRQTDTKRPGEQQPVEDPEDHTPIPGPGSPERPPSPPKQPPLLKHYPTAQSFTEDEIWLERLKPVIQYNSETPWPSSFYEQPLQAPAWYAACPEGYEPTTLAGYPIRRQYPTYIPAAHDSELVRDEYGHYCIDPRETREWDQCCMGK
ncbi:hypothetical protein KCU85_g2937, partial [Aureobasidium melanogenum]